MDLHHIFMMELMKCYLILLKMKFKIILIIFNNLVIKLCKMGLKNSLMNKDYNKDQNKIIGIFQKL